MLAVGMGYTNGSNAAALAFNPHAAIKPLTVTVRIPRRGAVGDVATVNVAWTSELRLRVKG
jgi:hypothetical protein